MPTFKVRQKGDSLTEKEQFREVRELWESIIKEAKEKSCSKIPPTFQLHIDYIPVVDTGLEKSPLHLAIRTSSTL